MVPPIPSNRSALIFRNRPAKAHMASIAPCVKYSARDYPLGKRYGSILW